jgi:hypothetical protein
MTEMEHNESEIEVVRAELQVLAKAHPRGADL